jgi:putative endonuclease
MSESCPHSRNPTHRGSAVPQSGPVAAKDELGRQGETLAVEHLENAGLTVLHRNWRCAEGELDIVATDEATTMVVFCEVKTRRGVGYGTPFEAVTQGKRRKLRRLGMLWLSENRVKAYPTLRFDVIGVLWLPGEPPRIEHRAQAF